MLIVACMPEGLTTEWTWFSSANFSAFMDSSQRSSKMNTYLSLSYRRRKPSLPSHHCEMLSSTASRRSFLILSGWFFTSSS